MVFKNIRLAAISLIAALLAVLSLPVSAQEPTPVDPYEDLYASINESFDEAEWLNSVLKEMRTQLSRDDWVQEIESESPGFLDDYLEAMQPPLLRSARKEWELERTRFVDLFRAELTEAEAKEVSAIFRTDSFRKLQTAIIDASIESIDLEEYADDDEVSEEDVEAFQDEVGDKAIKSLSSADRGDVEWAARVSPGFRKFTTLQPKMIAIRTEIENQEDPELDRELDDVVDRVLDKYFPDDSE
ncbi:hypothetical protein [Erythrobacter sp. F6033]|uniref:hypothetical protein n=1 Tax=Erythrobacter sp. F6033 TaxID=2926401 RepID=UPI001FF2438B|nr:hypothetical protein [Erythrobacter sp. F6033]MCK0127423.1 hypothetical protein [Erythrobacter sp. F6033]